MRIRKNLYAAKLVDLPTIVESSKTLDRKNLYKTGDICQMLLVGEQISHEETILAYPSRPSDIYLTSWDYASLEMGSQMSYSEDVSRV